MATVLNFEAFRDDDAPSHWVDRDASRTRAPRALGWARDLAGIAEVLFADELGPPDQERVRWAVEKTREYTAAVGGKAAFAFRVGVAATSWIAPVMILRLPPLWRLSQSDRLRALKRYEASPLGLSLFAVKVFLGVNWFEHPDVAREVKFDGQCRGVAR